MCISAAPAGQGSERQRRAPQSAGGAGMFAQQTMREQGAGGSGDGPRYIKKRGSVTFVIEPLEERRLPTLPPGGAVPSA